ncbi:MAG TPA: hypothetical protein EYP81_04080, partial [Thermodesulfobacteriaceae bacterium]|nr:hypothetical protein [Thermodesulfobacteriaceae bacterium]
MRWAWWAMMLVLILSACTTTKPEAIVPPPPPEVPEIKAGKPSSVSEGSLFTEGGGLYFFEDHRARRVGDLVTIKIVESYQSSQ